MCMMPRYVRVTLNMAQVALELVEDEIAARKGSELGDELESHGKVDVRHLVSRRSPAQGLDRELRLNNPSAPYSKELVRVIRQLIYTIVYLYDVKIK